MFGQQQPKGRVISVLKVVEIATTNTSGYAMPDRTGQRGLWHVVAGKYLCVCVFARIAKPNMLVAIPPPGEPPKVCGGLVNIGRDGIVWNVFGKHVMAGWHG